MKYLLVIAVVAIFYLYLKKQRKPLRTPPPKARQPLAPPQPMQACAHCGLHLPARDAVLDADGQPYCSEAHRRAGARSHP